MNGGNRLMQIHHKINHNMECTSCKTAMQNKSMMSIKRANQSKSETVSSYRCPDYGHHSTTEREN
jgi:hypothetical protein